MFHYVYYISCSDFMNGQQGQQRYEQQKRKDGVVAFIFSLRFREMEKESVYGNTIVFLV
jgi:hypothetical protein